ncbi:MAG TPA: hypothetical protein VIB79_15635 [Candidatus Binatia bacterium]
MKLKSLILGSLVTGSLMLPAGAAFARVDWRDIRQDQARVDADNAQVREARRQLDFDLDHGARGYQIEQDHRAIQNALEDLRSDRELMRRDMADYDNFS